MKPPPAPSYSWGRRAGIVRGIVTAASGLQLVGRSDSEGDAEPQLRQIPIPARDHSAGDLALYPFHLELARRRRFVGGTRDHGLLRNHSALGEPFRADDRGGFAQTSPEAT